MFATFVAGELEDVVEPPEVKLYDLEHSVGALRHTVASQGC